MARTIKIDLLEQKIEKAQMDVVRTKNKYDVAVAELQNLMDKRDVIKRDALISAIMRSEKTYEEILLFIQNNN